jgi:NADH:ubiquinone oxidoreductase subunit E/NAD-dependent dihydropyrimidine dehydrogenase PreA subunit
MESPVLESVRQEAEKVGAVMVVGAGISGMQSALDLANAGFKVYLVDKNISIGGVMAQLDKTFPTNDCSTCMISPKLIEVAGNPNIEIITRTRLKGIKGEPGNFQVTLRKEPRYIDEEKCNACGLCMANCPVRNEVVLPEKKKAEILWPSLDEEAFVSQVLDQYREEPGNLLPVLLDINRHFHWLPRYTLEHVSQELSIPLTEILRVASFYNAFSLVPRGKHIISVCLGTGCFVKGSPRLLDNLERELGIKHGQTTADMMFSLEVVRCIGCCALAPAMRIGEDTFGRMTPSMIPKILKSYAGSYGKEEEEAA